MDETLTPWRAQAFNKYIPLVESLHYINDPIVICDTIIKRLNTSWQYGHTLAKYPVAMTLENMDRGKMGSCTHQTGMGIFLMRALGIPVVHEQVPHYGNKSLGHDFTTVIGKDNKLLDFEFGNSKTGDVVGRRLRTNRLIPKIYRQKYSINKKSLAVLKSENEDVPTYFRNPSIEDVTNSYLPTMDVDIDLIYPIPKGSEYVYLCVYDNQDWKPVDWSKIDKKRASFKDVGTGILYIPMFYKNQRFIPATQPIILSLKKNKIPVRPVLKKQKMVLKRKFTPNNKFKASLDKGKFQASNKANFKNAVDLYKINDSIELIYHDKLIEDFHKYRYVRYLFPFGKYGEIAEMSFFDENGIKLTGNTITSNNISDDITIGKAFDGDVLSYVFTGYNNLGQRDDLWAIDWDAQWDAQWVGLDFGSSKRISKISFCSRTDKNDIWPGLNYELFYWDTQWKSIGREKSNSNELIFESPVSNALYLLRCLDEGKEERVFTYEKGKQIWW